MEISEVSEEQQRNVMQPDLQSYIRIWFGTGVSQTGCPLIPFLKKSLTQASALRDVPVACVTSIPNSGGNNLGMSCP